MSTVFITQPGAQLKIESGRLVIKGDDGSKHVILLHRVDQVVVTGHATISAGVVEAMTKADVDLIFLSRGGKYLGRIERPLSKNIFLRKRQYAKCDDPLWCLEVAREIVRRKISVMRVFAGRIRRESGLSEDADISARMDSFLRSINLADNIDSLRGMEGVATKAYFSILSQGIDDEDLKFSQRTRRPPADPANALLSFGYVVLSNAVHSDILRHGLDPFCGVLHADSYGRPSLTLDLMEEFRTILIDPCVLKVFNLKMLKTSHFQEHEEDSGIRGIWLTPDGIKIYLGAIQKRMQEEFFHKEFGRKMSFRKIITAHAGAFRDVIMGVRKVLPEMGWR